MIDTAKFLEENGYVFLQDFIDKNSCALMVDSLFDAIEKGKAVNDTQCPLSNSFYDVFGSAQEEILPFVEEFSGKKLKSTYNYCRVYMPNEVLEKHTDREACEYSITLTLGFDGEPWPFYIENCKGEEKVLKLSVGDAILYKGIERKHWREKYVEGAWQAQVFFHFVDVEGKYKEQPEMEKFKENFKHVYTEETPTT